MKMPEFSAETSLRKSSGRYQCVATYGAVVELGQVVSQLKGSVFHRPRLGRVFGTIEDYWTCKQGCETAHSACLATCEGTWESPKASSNCTICDQDYSACVQGCSRDIA